MYVLLPISPLEKVLQLLFWTAFFIWGTKKVVAGRVGQVVVLYSNGCMGICLGGLSICHLRWVVILQKWLLGQVWLYIYFYSIHICINTVHAELKILFQLPMALLLLHSCFFFIWNAHLTIWIINGATTFIWMINSATLINTNSKWIKKNLLEFILTSVGLAWHGWLFKDTYFMGIFKLETNNSPKLPIEQMLNNPINIF